MVMRFLIKNPSFKLISSSLSRLKTFSSLKPQLRYPLSTRFSQSFCTRLLRKSSNSITSLSSSKMGVVRGPDEEGITRRFWIKFKKESLFAMYTPFVVCLAASNMELDTFRHYIAQDVHFLKAFARAYELAEDCADDDEDKAAVREMRKSVIKELKIHGSFAQVCNSWNAYLMRYNSKIRMKLQSFGWIPSSNTLTEVEDS